MASTTRNLRLRLTPGLTVDAVYNLERLDAAVGNQLYTNASGLTLLRAERDIAIEPNSADVGGVGVGGTLYVGTPTHTLSALIVNAAAAEFAGTLGLRNAGGSLFTTIQSTPVSDTNSTLRLQLTSGSHTLALAGDLALGGSFTTSGHSLSLNLAGPTTLELPVIGTLATLAGVETLTNKTLTASTISNSVLNTVGLVYATLNNSIIDSTTIGSHIPSSGAFTTLSAASATVGNDTVVTALAPQTMQSKVLGNCTINAAFNTLTNVPYGALILTNSITSSDISSAAKKTLSGVDGRTVVTGGVGATLEPVEVDIDAALLPTPETAHIGYVLQAVAEGVATWSPIDVADEKVKASALDPAAGYLTDKITASSGAAVSVVGDSSLNITNTDKGSTAIVSHESAYAHGEIALNSAARHSAVSIGAANGLSLVGQVLSMGTASLSSAGALSASDWGVFNAKQDALVIGTIAGVSGRTSVVGGTNAIIGNGVSVDIATSLLPSPLETDAGKVLVASGANAAAWTTLTLPHNDLAGLQGGAVGDYQHLTASELSDVQNLGTISSKNLTVSTSLPSGSANEGDLWVVI